MGVWIETLLQRIDNMRADVTPFVGVWIETAKANDMRAAGLVTPFVGVWIETMLYPIFVNQWSGHTLRGCVD